MTNARRIVALIPASGVGSRMQAEKPKQYLTIAGKTILEHTLNAFLACEFVSEIVVAVAENDTFYPELACLKQPQIRLVTGGETRAHSVYNGLCALNEADWVLVHDAARPCITPEEIAMLCQVKSPDGALLAIPVVDTLKREAAGKSVETVDRSQLWRALTPQFFPVGKLKQALELAFDAGANVTDEASAMELMGVQPQLIEGNSRNIKITHPDDLALASYYLTQLTEKLTEK